MLLTVSYMQYQESISIFTPGCEWNNIVHIWMETQWLYRGAESVLFIVVFMDENGIHVPFLTIQRGDNS